MFTVVAIVVPFCTDLIYVYRLLHFLHNQTGLNRVFELFAVLADFAPFCTDLEYVYRFFFHFLHTQKGFNLVFSTSCTFCRFSILL